MAEQRLIDAGKLFTEFEKAAWNDNADRDDVAEELLLNAPTVDAVPVVHGHWIEHGTDEAVCSFSECSVCGTYIHMCHKFCEYESENYCPHCGATMDEPKEGYSDGR